jgi:hypothetical protein
MPSQISPNGNGLVNQFEFVLAAGNSMARKIFFAVLMALALVMTVYGGFFRQMIVYDNLEKFDQLKNIGIKIKIPGYQQDKEKMEVQSEWFTEPEMVNAMTFSGISRYKTGQLISNYPDLRMLKGRLPCPS